MVESRYFPLSSLSEADIRTLSEAEKCEKRPLLFKKYTKSLALLGKLESTAENENVAIMWFYSHRVYI
jgi:hypothetical protein